ncbi:hypothetical protein DIPPA_33248 [Diplonema papillatum]|nr:hypothetical protein DIPPA_33248 [Diplonema papillatum]|eukprot:gene18165-27995_t
MGCCASKGPDEVLDGMEKGPGSRHAPGTPVSGGPELANAATSPFEFSPEGHPARRKQGRPAYGYGEPDEAAAYPVCEPERRQKEVSQLQVLAGGGKREQPAKRGGRSRSQLGKGDALFASGDRVNVQGTRNYPSHPAWVINANPDGTCRVRFEDGEEDIVAQHLLEPRFLEGERVDARWKGGDWYRGWVSETTERGECSIEFDDGGYEPAQPAGHIRFAIDSNPTTKGSLPPPGGYYLNLFPPSQRHPDNTRLRRHSDMAHADRRN